MSFDWRMLQPDDGYFAVFEQKKDSAWLEFGMRVSGEVLYTREVGKVENPGPVEVGNLKRKLIVLKAVADYMNAGGYPDELPELMPQPGEGTIWTDGWSYFDGGLEPATGNRVFEFANETYDKFVRWVQNEYVDVDLTLEQIGDDVIRSSSRAASLGGLDSDEEGQADGEAD